MKILSALLALTFSVSVLAGVSVYSGTAGEKLFIEEGADGAFYLKFTGVKSAWADKVIKTRRTGKQDNYRYTFDYKLELSNGVHDRSYTMVTDESPTLVAGTIVPRVGLHHQEKARDGIKLSWDKELTSSSQAIKLESEFKKKPYTPDVD